MQLNFSVKPKHFATPIICSQNNEIRLFYDIKLKLLNIEIHV